MKNNNSISVQLDEHDNLVLPDAVLKQFGLTPGREVYAEISDHGLVIRRSIGALARVYIEPTNACNLDCTTCMRNVWDEPLGKMPMALFTKILEDLQSFDPLPSIFFGGFGEPLAHPEILQMLTATRRAGFEVELITNGTLLNAAAAEQLVAFGLNRLWVSIDGASPTSYADVRLGAELHGVIENLRRLIELRDTQPTALPKLGIAFVAMQKNIQDLPAIIRLGKTLGVDRFSISGVLPHTKELREQVLYQRSLEDTNLLPSEWSPVVSLPRSDPDKALLGSLLEIFSERVSLQVGSYPVNLGVNKCPFVEKGSVSIRWDGAVSPCLSLLHSHTSYLGQNLRQSHAYAVGTIQERSLLDLWNDPEYVRLRERLQDFDFSPCAFCNSCQMAESNLVDCFANDTPVCGGCLWAQGFIQCP